MKKRIFSFVTAAALCLTMAVPAFATNEDTDVQGHINDVTVGPTPSYDVTMSTSVHWWVTKAYPNDVVSGNASGPIDPDPSNPTEPNFITNNNTVDDINVAFVDFTLDNTDADDLATSGSIAGLDFTLTGDLDLTTTSLGAAYNLADGYDALLNPSAPYASQLLAGSTWTYGFEGTFNPATYPTTAIAPEYTMTLGFTF